jgi:uncharacterized glyoxalase superfamily protein PhnB
MLAEENPEMGARGPKSFGGSPLMLHLYVKDVDAMVEQAAKAGAKIVRACKISFTATARVDWRIPLATFGTSRVARNT